MYDNFPYEFRGFGAVDGQFPQIIHRVWNQFPYEFIGFGAMAIILSCEFIGFGSWMVIVRVNS